jgi:hypothetical protein
MRRIIRTFYSLSAAACSHKKTPGRLAARRSHQSSPDGLGELHRLAAAEDSTSSKATKKPKISLFRCLPSVHRVLTLTKAQFSLKQGQSANV